VKYFRTRARSILNAALAVSAAAVMISKADAADMATKAAPWPAPSEAYSTAIWLSSDFKNHVADGSVGGVYALSGNLDTSGWLLRGQANYAAFGIDNSPSFVGHGHGNFADGSGMIGYQVVGNGLAAAGFVGFDYQSYTINPRAANTNGLGDRGGVIFAGRLASAGLTQFPFAIDGQYSTAYNEFWVRARPGVKFGNVTVGPEVIGMGNNVYNEVRGGGYVSYEAAKGFTVQADLGYADGTRNDNGGRSPGSGVYGGVTLVFLH
jgi:hypothetical protein